jgi:3-dehydroquinate synthase
VTEDLSFIVDGARTEVQFRREPQWPDAAITVYDSNTIRLFGSGARNPVTIPAGEAAKGWPSVQAILAHCATVGIGRDATIAGVGGGVVCDVTAFAASLYMRGCGLVLIPTTLLAMVDASLGGKTGIDFQGYKNMVGTFYPASRILIAAETVRSLPDREYLSGIAEVIKTAIIGDPELFSLMENGREAVMSRDPSIVQDMIRRSLAVKGRIVEADPRESGERALLNLGHTFGHALETATGFTGWTHGEAVAWGMGRSLAAGARMGVTDRGFAQRLRSLLKDYGFRLSARASFDELLPAIERDKKRRGGAIRLVIPHCVGDVRVHEATAELIAESLAEDEES